MQKVKIITHSGSDLTFQDANELNITLLPDLVVFGNEQFRNNVDIFPEAFYARLEQDDVFPTSAHPNLLEFMNAFRGAAEYEAIICLVMSSQMTNTINTAKIAAQMVKEGRIRGYLAFDKGIAIGWCNANDRMNYSRVGEFDLDHVPEDRFPSDCQREGQIKSIVCFEISPEYRGKGIATMLLDRVCADALAEGYAYAEAYPSDQVQSSLAFTGPVRLYEKAGFTEFSRIGSTIVMRKKLR